MKIADAWARDIPQQFQGKHNIEVLIKAFSKQMQELEKVFQDLNTMTDIDAATGQNLDYVGMVIPLSRKEAGELAGLNFSEPVMSDERYRKYLRYQMLRNTSECTYDEIMESIEILWNVEKTRYYERNDRPATIFIGLPSVDIEEDDQAKGKPKIMKPAGVGFIYAAQYGTSLNQCNLEKIGIAGLDVHAYFRFFEAKALDGGWILDGFVALNQKVICEMDVGFIAGVMVHHKENVENGFVSMKKDLWYLDGERRMDGSKMLDAEIREEGL